MPSFIVWLVLILLPVCLIAFVYVCSTVAVRCWRPYGSPGPGWWPDSYGRRRIVNAWDSPAGFTSSEEVARNHAKSAFGPSIVSEKEPL